jgi:hypothetical protein
MAAAFTARMSPEFAQPKNAAGGGDGARAWGSSGGTIGEACRGAGSLVHAATNRAVHSTASLVFRLSFDTNFTPIAQRTNQKNTDAY